MSFANYDPDDKRADADPWDIVVGVERGHVVAHHPATRTTARVSLRATARKLERKGQVTTSPQLMRELDALTDVDSFDVPGEEYGSGFEAGGRIGRKIKKGLKKVASAAKKIAKSKVVSALYSAVKSAVPPPYNAAVMAAETGVKFAGNLAKKPGHRKALPLLQAAALGRGPVDALVSRAAKHAGIGKDEAKAVAVAIRTRANAAKGDKRAAAIVQATSRIERARQGDPDAARSAVAMASEAKLRAQFPGARVVRVTGPDGKQYLSAVIQLAAG